jgi:hypothetical protein
MLTRTLFVALLLLSLSSPALAQRVPPPAADPGPFSAPVVEQGAIGDLQVVALDALDYAGDPKVLQDLLFYDRTSGAALLVVSLGALYGVVGHPLYECVRFVWFAPGLTLTAQRMENKRAHDLLGYQPATGQVYRYFRRGAPGC